MSALDKILEIVAKSGPVLPVEIASRLKINSLIVRGYLSQLVDIGKLKASDEKVAGTSVYFVAGQESVAKKRVSEILNTAQKTARTFAKTVPESPEIQKKREAFADRLKQIEQREKKVIPVTISQLKENFTISPGRHAVGGEHKIPAIKKVHVEAPKGAQVKEKPEISYEIIEKRSLSNIHKPEVSEDKLELEPTDTFDPDKPEETEVEVERTVSKVAQKPRKRGRKKKEVKPLEDGKIVQSALSFLVEAGAEIISKELKRKGKDADIILLLPTPIGNIQMFTIIKEKKNISEADLSMAYTEGMKRKLPVLFITNGSLTKASREYYESIAGFLKFKSLSE